MDFSRYKLSFNDAKSRIEEYDFMNDTEFRDQIRHWARFDVPEDTYGAGYSQIRKSVVEEFKSSLSDNGNRINYNLDLRVGIKLYELLNPINDFSIIQANDDDIWRYISVIVMPDLTFIRYPNLNEDVKVIREYIPDLSYAIGIKTEKDSVRIKKSVFILTQGEYG